MLSSQNLGLLRLHHLVLFLEAGFVNFLFFEFIFKRSDISKGDEAAGVDIVLAGLPQIEVAVFPESLFVL